MIVRINGSGSIKAGVLMILKIEFFSSIRGYHIYKDIGSSVSVREELTCLDESWQLCQSIYYDKSIGLTF